MCSDLYRCMCQLTPPTLEIFNQLLFITALVNIKINRIPWIFLNKLAYMSVVMEWIVVASPRCFVAVCFLRAVRLCWFRSMQSAVVAADSAASSWWTCPRPLLRQCPLHRTVPCFIQQRSQEPLTQYTGNKQNMKRFSIQPRNRRPLCHVDVIIYSGKVTLQSSPSPSVQVYFLPQMGLHPNIRIAWMAHEARLISPLGNCCTGFVFTNLKHSVRWL